LNSKIKQNIQNALWGSALCVALGLVLLHLVIGERLVPLSYDLLFLFRKPSVIEDTQIIYMDEDSFAKLGQKRAATWDRDLHSDLLNRLTADGSKLVVFDIVFSEPGTPEANTNFARAIQRNGKVALAAGQDDQSTRQIKSSSPVLPLQEFMDVAAGWGIAEVPRGDVVRQYLEFEGIPSLARVAATLVSTNVDPQARFLNYYGPPLAIPNTSYHAVSNKPSGYFTNKTVFVGARPKTLKSRDQVDVFATPHTLWTGDVSPGVELMATAFLNILRKDGFVRMGAATELLLVLVSALVFGAGLSLLRPAWATAMAIAGAAFLLIVALQLAQRHIWFAWTVIAAGQIPCALAWSLRSHFQRMKFEKDVLERTLVATTRWTQAEAKKTGLVIPDHALVRRVGKGAYGEVWLARNAVGVFHAVKVVKRADFPQNTPYEREFKGIQKFMPISRSHPGLVHVLHVGRDDAQGFFFYIMEVGDDADTGQRIDPEKYSARTLASDLARHGKLPPEQCLQLAMALTLALHHLHQHGLVHRDIKPGNIIYVNGAPKFADIGLVTDLQAPGRHVSAIGTEGYIAPEGPGTAAADVYALGKMLYEAAMGRDRLLFPEVPTAVLEQPDDTLVRQLHEVICKACETNPTDRYQSALEMHADLQRLQNLTRI
jgi:CHASE2 domain-containing sensor protein